MIRSLIAPFLWAGFVLAQDLGRWGQRWPLKLGAHASDRDGNSSSREREAGRELILRVWAGARVT